MTLCIIKDVCIITIAAAKHKHAILRKCCYDGAHLNYDETCERRAARIKIGPKCIKVFKECCIIANQIRDKESHKDIQLGRLRKFDIFKIRIQPQLGHLV